MTGFPKKKIIFKQIKKHVFKTFLDIAIEFFLKHKPFFNSLHEIALYDLPTTIDYVLEETNQKKLSILGYSIGSVATCMLLSTKMEYNRKIMINIFMAPAVFLKNVFSSPFHSLVVENFKYFLVKYYCYKTLFHCTLVNSKN